MRVTFVLQRKCQSISAPLNRFWELLCLTEVNDAIEMLETITKHGSRFLWLQDEYCYQYMQMNGTIQLPVQLYHVLSPSYVMQVLTDHITVTYLCHVLSPHISCTVLITMVPIYNNRLFSFFSFGYQQWFLFSWSSLGLVLKHRCMSFFIMHSLDKKVVELQLNIVFGVANKYFYYSELLDHGCMYSLYIVYHDL